MLISPSGSGYGHSPTANGPHIIKLEFDGSEFITPMQYQPLAGAAERTEKSISANYGQWRGCQTTVDLTQYLRQSGMRTLQSIYIDTSDVLSTVLFVCQESGHRIVARAGTQGWYPLITGDPIGLALFDVAIMSQDWDMNVVAWPKTPNWGSLGPIPYANGTALSFPARLRVMLTDIAMPASQWDATEQKINTWLELSGTITTGGQFETIDLGDTTYPSPRKGLLMQNPYSATELLYLDFADSNTAYGAHVPSISTAIELAPGAIYQERGDPVCQNRIRAMAPTTGHAYKFKVMT